VVVRPRAARDVDWPNLAISSFVLAPVIAASVLPVWRRSWGFMPSMPSSVIVRFHAEYHVARRSGCPLCPPNTSPFFPGAA
jgi:hypothetical protein